jgi:hypothetical protein
MCLVSASSFQRRSLQQWNALSLKLDVVIGVLHDYPGRARALRTDEADGGPPNSTDNLLEALRTLEVLVLELLAVQLWLQGSLDGGPVPIRHGQQLAPQGFRRRNTVLRGTAGASEQQGEGSRSVKADGQSSSENLRDGLKCKPQHDGAPRRYASSPRCGKRGPAPVHTVCALLPPTAVGHPPRSGTLL